MKNINAIIRARTDSIKRDQAALKELKANKFRLDTLCAMAHAIIQPTIIPKGENSWDMDIPVEMEVSASYWSPTIEVTANVMVESFKSDANLYGILQRAKEMGLKYIRADEDARYERVSYRYEPLNGMTFVIHAKLKAGATKCKRVEVGRKIVEREEVEYKLVCE